MSKRTFKEDKLAKIYDSDVVPIWSKRFGRLLLRDLTVPNKAMVLDVNCGSGYPSLDILKRMDEQGRIIAVDTSSPLLDEARTKAGKLSGKRIFFRSETALPKLPFAEQVYDLVVSNAGLQQMDDPEPAVRECARVTKVGGQVVATFPLAGTFTEFHDIFREVLIKGDYKDAIDRLDAYLTRYPPLEQAVAWFEDAGLSDVTTELESFTLLFKSSREFFFAPIIEYGPLSAWKAIAGKGQQMQDVFWQTKAAIDAYFHGSSFSVTVHAGCVRGRKLMREASVQVPVPQEPSMGVRASSDPRRSRSGSDERRAREEEANLPDAPSDEVDALSGSWPRAEVSVVGGEPSGEAVGAKPLDNLADLDQDFSTGLVPKAMPEIADSLEPPATAPERALHEDSGLSQSIDDEAIEEDEPVGGLDLEEDAIEAPFEDAPFDREEAAAFDAERRKATPPSEPAAAAEADDAAAEDDDEEVGAVPEVSGIMQLATGEIELIEEDEDDDDTEGSAPKADPVRKVRRPSDPDDPDIL